MTHALRSLDYQGSFVYLRDGRIDALRIYHAAGTPDRERLVSLGGPPREVVRDGDSMVFLRGDLPSVVFPNPSGATLLPLAPVTVGPRFAHLYSTSTGRDDRVAGYAALVVNITPVDGYRYGYRLWLERSSKMLLRAALLDGAGRSLEEFMFVSLDLGAKPKDDDLTAARVATTSTPPDEVALGGPPRWRVNGPPPGFTLARAQRLAPASALGEHLSYSDGIASVSVYVEPRDVSHPAAVASATTRGSLNIVSRDEGSWTITVLGDVPRATVDAMSRSTVEVQGPSHRRPSVATSPQG